MQAIPDQLLSQLDRERVIIGSPVINIDDNKNITLDNGTSIKGNRFILSGESTALLDGQKRRIQCGQNNVFLYTE